MEKCLSIKGAEDVINKPHAFEISTSAESMFYIADTDKDKVRGSCQALPRLLQRGLNGLERTHGEGVKAALQQNLQCKVKDEDGTGLQDCCLPSSLLASWHSLVWS